ncbi:MAG: hypothetical protein U0935_03440 [Pirellulales bacterium]
MPGSRGLKLDLTRLEQQLGVPLVPVQAHRKLGIDELLARLAACPLGAPGPPPPALFPRRSATKYHEPSSGNPGRNRCSPAICSSDYCSIPREYLEGAGCRG